MSQEGISNLVKEIERLTSRRIEILSLIGTGYTDKEVARRLNVAVKTIRNQRASLLNILCASNAAQLAVIWYSYEVATNKESSCLKINVHPGGKKQTSPREK